MGISYVTSTPTHRITVMSNGGVGIYDSSSKVLENPISFPKLNEGYIMANQELADSLFSSLKEIAFEQASFTSVVDAHLAQAFADRLPDGDTHMDASDADQLVRDMAALKDSLVSAVLVRAASEGLLDAVKVLTNPVVTAPASSPNFEAALMGALETGQLDVVRFLHETRGVDISSDQVRQHPGLRKFPVIAEYFRDR